MQTDTEHLGARREESGSECHHSAELFWAEGVEGGGRAPEGLQSQEQSQTSCLRSQLPNTHRDCSFYGPTKDHLGGGCEGQELLLGERLSPGGLQGPWQL